LKTWGLVNPGTLYNDTIVASVLSLASLPSNASDCELLPKTPYMRTSMRRHYLSRSTWRPLCGGRNGSLCPSRYASIRALGELTLVVARRIMGSVFSGRRRCNLLSGLPGRVDQVRISQSPSGIRSAFGHQRPSWPSATVGSSRCSMALPSPPPCSVCSIAALLLSRLLPLLAPMRVVERIVDLPANPQVVQKHRELPRYGHRRSLLGVLAPARSYLLSMAP
jgi:hypothetical protein